MVKVAAAAVGVGLLGLAGVALTNSNSERSGEVAATPAAAKEHVGVLKPVVAHETQRLQAGDRGLAGNRSHAPVAIHCDVTDGDTLKCAGRRIRLAGIDAPELPGHCREGRACVEGDPFGASLALERLIASADLQIVVTGRDPYGREIANVYADGKNIACDLIAGGHAIYEQRWDDAAIVQEDCGITGL